MKIIDQVMHDLRLPSDASARVRRGEMVVSKPPPASPHELAVGLTFFVEKPMANVIAAFRSAVDIRSDRQIRAIGIIGGSLDDFASVVVPAGAARRYLDARPGDALNLSADEIEMFSALATTGTDLSVTEALRRMLFARYRAYLDRGLDGIAPYARARGVVRKPSDELLAACDATPLLRRYAPLAWALLHSYPRDKPPDLDERFYVLTYELDGRPNFTLRHRMAVPFDGGVVLAERDFYVSHGYNTSQVISGVIAVAGGTIVFYANRVSTDQLTGVGSSLKQAIGNNVMAAELTAMFEGSRACFTDEAMCPALPTGHTLAP